MGGSIAITIREKDGKEHRMCRWTNPIPYFANNIGLINKDKAHLDEYLKQWYTMVDDAKTAAGRERSPMAKGYTSHPYLAPYGYGLIVIDMKEDVIIDCQGYSHIGKIEAVKLRLELRHNDDDVDSAVSAFRALYAANKISGVRWYDGTGERVTKVNGTLTIDEIFAALSDTKRRDDPIYNGAYVLDMSPFKIEQYPEYNAKAYEAMLKRIKELGFKLSKKEEQLWQTEIQRLKREE